MKIEVCVDSIRSARTAGENGADRIELCSALEEGGVTPSFGLVKSVKELYEKEFSNVNIFVLIRPRSGDFLYSREEIEIMKEDIRLCKDLNISGVVIGALTENGDVDIEIMKELINETKPNLQITFHRAIDMTNDILLNLERIFTELPEITRILTSGSKATAEGGISTLHEMVNKVKELEKENNRRELIIMAGSGVNEKNVQKIIEETGVIEVHSSCRREYASHMKYINSQCSMSSSSSPSAEYSSFFADAEKIRQIKEILKSLGGDIPKEDG